MLQKLDVILCCEYSLDCGKEVVVQDSILRRFALKTDSKKLQKDFSWH